MIIYDYNLKEDLFGKQMYNFQSTKAEERRIKYFYDNNCLSRIDANDKINRKK